MTPREIEIAIISDVHLGASTSRVRELIQYLQSIRTETLVINGNLFSPAHRSKKRLPTGHQEVLNNIIEKSVTGTKVYFVTRKHEQQLGLSSNGPPGNILFRDQLEFHYKNKKHLILPDTSTSGKYATRSRHTNSWRQHMQRWMRQYHRRLFPEGEVFGNARLASTATQRPLSKSETEAMDKALDEGYDYIICSHPDAPIITSKSSSQQVITYLNTGDWTNFCTALEYRWGKWSIYEYHELDYGCISPRLRVEKSTKGRVRKLPRALNDSLPLPDSAAE
ncbi:MAG: hypothetical protein AAFV95_11390 [Bacteroidota bacterium]